MPLSSRLPEHRDAVAALDRAVYLDFEALKTEPPHPALLGVLIGGEGEDIEQLILDPRLAPAYRANPRRTRVQTTADAVDAILNLARVDDRRIVGWSNFDRDLMTRARPDLGNQIRAQYTNALEIARPWRQKVHPTFSVEREDRFSPKHTLDKYARLADYPRVDALQSGRPAAWIRHTLKGLAAKDGRYRRITPEAKRDWHRVLEYNRHDLLALRHIVLIAVRELGLWRAYEGTTFCVGDDRRRICFRAGSRSETLDRLLARRNAVRWAFITASNPGSVQLSESENARRNAELRGRVTALGLEALNGEGIGQDPAWGPEQSLLILNVSRGRAVSLGRAFGQLAIVTGRRGEPSSLVATG